MKYMKKIIFILPLLVLFTVIDANAQKRVGTTSATFLTMGVGAKGSALGHANSINTSGAEALYWNPAGISIKNEANSKNSGFLSVNELFVDVSAYAASFVFPIGDSGKNFGFGVNYVDYGRQLVRTVEDQDGLGNTFGAHDLSIGISYAQNLTENFHFGGTMKFVQQKIYDMQAQTVAVDVGFLLKTNLLNGTTLGASISNFGGKMQMDGVNSEYFLDIDEGSDGNNTDIPSRIYMDKWDIPLSFKVGVSIPAIKQENLELLLLSEAQQTNDNELNVDSGSQLSYISNTVRFHTRVGYKDLLLGDKVDSHFTYGAGFILKTQNGMAIGVDFAQVPYEYLGQTTIIDLKLYF
ncbi:MAG: hypothetical protein BalsKO_31560 [Balneolaceae bacterium]